MARSPLSPHLASPDELKRRIETERTGKPFLVYREERGGQRIVALDEGTPTMLGRAEDCEICLDWDARVSRLHAQIERIGRHWVVVDDGLSRNGTYLNGERITGRKRLVDGDQLEVGGTAIVFREPRRKQERGTEAAGYEAGRPEFSQAQLRVLVALCRPFLSGDRSATPASNREIADELSLSVSAVKTHLRLLFQRFGLGGLGHNEKRAQLARKAIDLGLVAPADLDAVR